MSVAERIKSRTKKTEGGCIEWLGATYPSGHGAISFRGNGMKAHRALWIETFGDLDSKTVVRHKCHNAVCVNLEHLCTGTQADNNRDMIEAGRHGMKNKTHCPKGHEYTEKNTRTYTGRRWCRACDNERSRIRYNMRVARKKK